MYEWPSHFPQICPPESADELVGDVFRFINGKTPADRDFLSHYERDNSSDYGANACKARGLSVLRSLHDCHLMRIAVPALRKKRIAHAGISTNVGLVAPTPSLSCTGHSTWWRHPSPSDVCRLFVTFEEQGG